MISRACVTKSNQMYQNEKCTFEACRACIIVLFSLILYSRKSHNTSCLPPPPQKKILHNDCIRFLLGHEDDLKEIENNGYANFWGLKEVYYGICESRELNTQLK